MLDVHPPHEAAHTWKDFFIHIATIVIGLLIAVSLEQTVEFFHHRHQRRELLESLKSDTEVLVEDGRARAELGRMEADWLLDREKRVNQALQSGRRPVSLPEAPQLSITEVLSYTHFEAARASGALQLLSTEDLDAFSDVNLDVLLSTDKYKTQAEAHQRRHAFEAGFLDAAYQHLDLSKASPTDLRQYLRLLSDERRAATGERFQADVATGAAEAVLGGERGIRKLQQAENEATAKEMGASLPYRIPTTTQPDAK